LLSRTQLKELDKLSDNICKKEIPRKLKQLMDAVKVERQRVRASDVEDQVSTEVQDLQAMKCQVNPTTSHTREIAIERCDDAPSRPDSTQQATMVVSGDVVLHLNLSEKQCAVVSLCSSRTCAVCS
jgi:hypothetical protein